MRLESLVLCLLLILGFSQTPVQIQSVATRIDNSKSNLGGSLLGGTVLYIKALGLDPTPSNNQVRIGSSKNVACSISDKGVNGIDLACSTIANLEKDLVDQPVYLTVKGSSEITCAACKFSFLDSRTPKLQNIVPRSVQPNEILQWQASFVVNTVDEIQDQLIGGLRCSRFDIVKQNPTVQINTPYVNCQVSAVQPAGYNLATLRTDSGYATQVRALNSFSIINFEQNGDPKRYQVISLAQIQSIGTPDASINGKIITISGSGFSQVNTKVYLAGTEAIVKSVSSTSIQAEIPAFDPNYQPTIISGNPQYVGGAGLRYTKYDMNIDYTGSCTEFRKRILANATRYPILEDRIKGEPSATNVGQRYGEYYRGYFKAPATGKHTFYLAADDCAQIWMNMVPGSSNTSNVTQIAGLGCCSSEKQYFNYQTRYPEDKPNQRSAEIDMKEGELYYIQIFFVQGGGAGFFSVALQVPSPKLRGDSMKEIIAINVSYTPDYEIFQFSIYNGDANTPLGGTYKLNFKAVDSATRKVIKDSTSDDLSATATKDDLEWELRWGCGVPATVVSVKVDNSGTPLTDQTSSSYAGYQHKVTVTSFRDLKVRVLPNIITSSITGSVQTSVISVQEPSPVISGVYGLTYGDKSVSVDDKTDIPIDVSLSSLASGISSATGLEVVYWSNGNCIYDGCVIYLQFQQPGPLASNLSVQTNSLNGGKIGTTPKITISDYIPGSNNAFLDPVPAEVFFTAHDTPQVQVQTNGLYSVCKEPTCNLVASSAKTPILDAFSLDSTGLLSMTVTDPRTTKFSKEELTIYFADQICLNVSKVDDKSITCAINKDLQAGSWLPSIHINSIGYVKPADTLTNTSQSITISSIDPSSDSTFGGSLMTLSGSGFPNDFSCLSKFIIKIGDVTVPKSSFQQVSTLQLVFKIPAQGTGSNINVTSGSLQAINTDFQYSELKTVRIRKITPSTSSPIKKVPVKIEGTNFGGAKGDLKVFLIGKRTYELNILNVTEGSQPTPDVIWAYLGGGQSGTYSLSVNRVGCGQSQAEINGADAFSYVVKILSISPAAGSSAGGTILTVTGENFVAGSNQVYIGNAVNWVCNIISESATEIKCITPPKYSSSEYDSAVNVTVTANIVDESVCFGDCNFTYDSAKTPTQTLPSDALTESTGLSRRILLPHHQNPHRRFLWDKDAHNDNHPKFFIGQPNRRKLLNVLPIDNSTPLNYKEYNTDDNVTIQGTVFGDNPQVIIGLYGLVTTFTAKSATSLTFAFPSLPAGIHTLQVAHETYGYATGSWNAHVLLKLTSVTPTSGSKGGQLLTIVGGGFNTLQSINDAKKSGETRSFPTVTVGGLSCKELQVVTSEKLTCVSPSFNTVSAQPIVISQINTLTLKQDTASGISFTTDATLTPTISGVNYAPNQVDPTRIDMEVTGVKLDGSNPSFVLTTADGEKNSAMIVSVTSTNTKVNFQHVVGGIYNLSISYGSGDQKAFAFFEDSSKVVVTQPSVTFSINTSPLSSILGGAQVTLSGQGFSRINKYNQPYVCGLACPVISSTSTEIVCSAPPLNTAKSMDQYLSNILASQINLNDYNITYDRAISGNPLTDGDLSTNYFSNSASCYFQVDFGDQVRLRLKQLSYLPLVSMAAISLLNGTFTYSTDGTSFTTLLTITGTVHTGWNYYALDDGNEISNIRYLRFNGVSVDSKCRLSELQIKGWILYKDDLDLSAGTCPVTLFVNKVKATGTGSVQYKSSLTPNVTAFQPAYGKSPGGDKLTITGEGFGTEVSAVSVKISGVSCAVTSCEDTKIECTTGDFDKYQQDNGITDMQGNNVVVSIKQQVAQLKVPGFFYANSWSDDAIWGGDIPPRDGDVVVVPHGQTLMVDIEQSPKLYSVLVEGTMLFKDGMDINFYSSQILVMMGKLQIGTYTNPRQSKLTITLSGTINDVQLPDFGNKFIGCHMCTLDIHGKKRQKTWSLLAKTVEKGEFKIQLIEEVDWYQGDVIVITSTNWDHKQSEVFQIAIVGVEEGKTTLTLNDTIKYRHYSAIEVYGQDSFPMQAEVGLLTRNILIQGDPADSIASQYGAHLMVHGTASGGAIGRISYTEFTNVGQPVINGRYPIHFHLNGPMLDSFVEGNSIHHSHARIITIHGTHYLRIFKNVGYQCLGHAIFLEDGIEQFNDIHDNLIIGAKQAWQMQQTDITTASYWLTNPLNYVYNNRAGGSEWYGFWYQIKDHPDGASATEDICPPGLPIGSFKNNTAHSNGRFGLRILKMAAVQYPCKIYRTNSVDPFASNPSIQSVFENFTTFANHESGVLGEQIGNIKFKNIKTADNKRAGFESYLTNLTKEGGYVEDWLIVGQSQGNSQNQEYQFFQESSGIITPRSNGLSVSNVRFWNFFAGMNLLYANSFGDNFLLVISSSKTTFFEKLSVKNSSDFNWIFWNGLKRNIFWDLDGSLTNLTGGGYLVPQKIHLNGVPGCKSLSTDPLWGQTQVCDKNSTIRDILINNPQPTSSFLALDTIIHRLTSFDENITLADENTFQKESWIKIMLAMDVENSIGTPFAAGYYYNVHWQNGIDFQNVGFQGSEYFTPEDPGVVLRFNYSSSRETFDVTRLAAGTIYNYSLSNSTLDHVPDPLDCKQGDNYHDNTTKLVYLCISGKNKLTPWEYINLNPVICRFNCSTVPSNEGKKDIPKTAVLWSDPNIWPNKKVPDGTEPFVLIPGNLSVTLDVSPPLLKQLIVDGEINFPSQNNSQSTPNTLSFLQNNTSNPELVLKVKTMWIRFGTVNIGSSTQPYVGRAAIELTGVKNDQSLLIDPFIDASNKVLAVTGTLNIYAQTPSSVWTRLAAFASAGDSQITVLSAQDWAIGDQIAIAPSGMIPQQHEIRSITAISGNTVTLDKPLSYNHYGAKTITINKPGIGQLDMRTPVAHLTRNVQIRGNSAGNWGGRLLVYQFQDEEETYKGIVNLYGAEFNNMGQPDTYNAGIDFRYTNNDTLRNTSSVVGCSFHNSPGMHLNADSAYDLFINNNVFYNAIRFSVRMVRGVNNTFTNSLIIYNQLRKIPNDFAVAAVFLLEDGDYDYSITNINISYNIIAGSEGTGIYSAAAQCDKEDQAGMFNNTASCCASAAIAFKTATHDCTLVFDHGAYHSSRGLMLAENSIHIYARNLIAVENQQSFVMKGGSHELYNNSYWAKNIYISAVARPDCPQCYSKDLGSPCANQQGMQITTLSSVAFSPYQTKFSGFETICTNQKLGVETYLTNMIFENYKLKYNSNDPTFKQCSNNIIFTPHGGATDSSFAHYMKNVTCPGCDNDAKFRFDDPSQGQIGWFGGCGSFVCTGQLNILMSDTDGSFLGKPSVAIPNNSWYGGNVTACQRVDAWNGYLCPKTTGIFFFLSIAPDAASRLYSPVTLTDGVFYNQVNSFKEWTWEGPEPMNTRESMFIALITLNTTINMTNSGQNPSDSQYFLSRRGSTQGAPQDWIIVKLQYQTDHTLEVLVGKLGFETPVSSFIGDQVKDLTKYTGKCGANNYFADNMTIHFVVTGDPTCLVRIRQSNSVKISMRMTIDYDKFFSSSTNLNQFNQVYFAFLSKAGIDTSKVKTVGYARGSVIRVDALIAGDATDQDSTSKMAALNSVAKQLQAEMKKSTGSFSNLGYSLAVTAITQTKPINTSQIPSTETTNGTTTPSVIIVTSSTSNNSAGSSNVGLSSTSGGGEDDTGKTTGIIVGVILGFLFLAALIGGIIFMNNKKQNKVLVIEDNPSSPHTQKADKLIVPPINGSEGELLSLNRTPQDPQY